MLPVLSRQSAAGYCYRFPLLLLVQATRPGLLTSVASPLTYAGWDSCRGSASASVTQLAWRSSSSSLLLVHPFKPPAKAPGSIRSRGTDGGFTPCRCTQQTTLMKSHAESLTAKVKRMTLPSPCFAPHWLLLLLAAPASSCCRSCRLSLLHHLQLHLDAYVI